MPRRAKGSSSGSRPSAEQLELALFAPADAGSREPGLWEQVEALPEKTARYHRERRKLVNRKLRQAELLEVQTEPVGSVDEAAAPPQD